MSGFYGMDMVDEKLSKNCPSAGGSNPTPGIINPSSSPFSFYFYVTLGTGVGIIVILLFLFGIYSCKLNRGRSGYEEIRDTDRISIYNTTGTPSLQEVLSASGGKIDANDIEIDELIGQGSFANVYRGKIHETDVAVKVIKCVSNMDLEQSLLSEAALMVKLRHPNIVLFMGACIKTPDLFLVTEFMLNGSVREILDSKDVGIEPEHIKRLAIDASKGMTYLHSKKIVHRDLKTHNLLVDGSWNVKVADFGLSRTMIEQESGTMTACGTPSWAAPEVLRRDHYTHKADVYSFAICLWEMCTRQRPYGELKPYQVVISVATDGLRPDLKTYPIPPYFEQVIVNCWNDKPEERPDFTQLRDILAALRCPAANCPYPVYRKEDHPISRSMPNVVDRSLSKRKYSLNNEVVQ